VTQGGTSIRETTLPVGHSLPVETWDFDCISQPLRWRLRGPIGQLVVRLAAEAVLLLVFLFCICPPELGGGNLTTIVEHEVDLTALQ